MRYIVQGAGAIGCLVGGLLADSGAEVILIARPSQADTINQHGITIHSVFHPTKQVTNIKAVTSPHDIAPQPGDVLMLAVKSTQTNHCIHELHEVFPQDTPLFCLQNGVRNETTAAERFLHVYGVMIAACVNHLEPGVVCHTLKQDLVIGNYPLGCDEIATKVAQDLSKAGFNAVLSGHVMAAKWGKLVLNLTNALLAATGHHLQLAWNLPEVSLLMAEVQEEGIHVVEASGIPLAEGNSPLDVYAMTRKTREVGENVPDQEAIRAAENLPENHRTYVSTWFDLKRQHGECEASYLNGEILLLGEKHSIPTPYNFALLDLVERMAAQHFPPGHYSIAEVREMIEQKKAELTQPSA
ncbi:MAG: ketopantoate reductase family protein [Acidobacteria bacterium]|nr:ketopantoate reductase family protein [Acidobacteriota bacterium]